MKQYILTSLLAATTVALSSTSSKAAVLVTFDDSAPGAITATLVGSIDLFGLNHIQDDEETPSTVSDGRTDALMTWVTGNPSRDSYGASVGITANSGLNTVPDVGLTSTFGYALNALFVPFDTPVNGIHTLPPNSFWQWNAENLSDIGLASLSSSTPLTVWRNPRANGTDGEIQFIAVPEPTTALLSIFPGLFLLRRHRT